MTHTVFWNLSLNSEWIKRFIGLAGIKIKKGCEIIRKLRLLMCRFAVWFVLHYGVFNNAAAFVYKRTVNRKEYNK
ncbi:hypothetical protein AKG09_07360 [Neisseria sp. 83E34]|nr:hypothetical protein AKG09_07360 [Neisseria sp. 83E34]